jgi:hypothetical protein
MGQHKRSKKVKEIKYEDVPKYAKKRERELKIRKFKRKVKKVVGKKRDLKQTVTRAKPVLKKVGEAVRKGVEFERKAFKFGAEAVRKGWEFGFEKPLEMREKALKEMEKQREELGY